MVTWVGPPHPRTIHDFVPVGTTWVDLPPPTQPGDVTGRVRMCNDCGALVVDPARHEVFHRRLRVQLGLL